MATSFSVVCAALAFVLLFVSQDGHCKPQELFAYPEDIEISSYLTNANNRTPVYIPGKCSKDEILYPGDHANDWVCDCRPGYVYYPQEDSCYPLFQKGFCQPGEYVDLERPSMIVKCTVNTCPGKNIVPYKGKCVELRRNNKLCPVRNRVSWVIDVNVTTLELDCVKASRDALEIKVENRNTAETEDQPMKLTSPRPAVIFFEEAKLCSNGTKAMYNGKCTQPAGQ